MPPALVPQTAAAAVAAAKKNEMFSRARREQLALGDKGNKDKKTSKSKARITVTLRKRPLTPQEQARGEIDILNVTTKRDIRVDEPRMKITGEKYIDVHDFKLDRVYDENCKNLELYNSCIKPLVDAVFTEGGRCSCFAYGQTGSGKTHTMIGPAKLKNFGAKELKIENKGVFELSAGDLMKWIETPKFSSYGLFVSFFEIYCNKVYDLLQGRKVLRALETKTADGVVVKDLICSRAETENQLMKFIEVGLSERIVGKNSRNADSSRGHAILTLEVRHLQNQSLHGKLAFIDLAGSERGVDTLNAGRMTQQDGVGINRSLLALKECIRALDLQSPHIPFRDSELTKVLRDMFMATQAQTVMIANVSPTATCCEQTLNTLRYADRVVAMRQHCKPCLNEADLQDAEEVRNEDEDRDADPDSNNDDFGFEEIEDVDESNVVGWNSEGDNDDDDEDQSTIYYEEMPTARGCRSVIAEFNSSRVKPARERPKVHMDSSSSRAHQSLNMNENATNSNPVACQSEHLELSTHARPQRKELNPRRPVTSAVLKSSPAAPSDNLSSNSTTANSLSRQRDQQRLRAVTSAGDRNQPPGDKPIKQQSSNQTSKKTNREMNGTSLSSSDLSLDGSPEVPVTTSGRSSQSKSLTTAKNQAGESSQLNENNNKQNLGVSNMASVSKSAAAVRARNESSSRSTAAGSKQPVDFSVFQSRLRMMDKIDRKELLGASAIPLGRVSELDCNLAELLEDKKKSINEICGGSLASAGKTRRDKNPLSASCAAGTWIREGKNLGLLNWKSESEKSAATSRTTGVGNFSSSDFQTSLQYLECAEQVQTRTPNPSTVSKVKSFLPPRIPSSKSTDANVNLQEIVNLLLSGSHRKEQANHLLKVLTPHVNADPNATLDSLEDSTLSKLQSELSILVKERREIVFKELHSLIASDSQLSLQLLSIADKFDGPATRGLLGAAAPTYFLEKSESLRDVGEQKMSNFYEFSQELVLFERALWLDKRIDEAYKKRCVGSIEFYASTNSALRSTGVANSPTPSRLEGDSSSSVLVGPSGNSPWLGRRS